MRLNRSRRGFTNVLKLDSFAISSANGHTSNTIPVKAATWILKQTPRSCSISKPTANSLTSISPRPFPSRFPGCANWWSSFPPRATSFAAKPHALSRDGKSKAQVAACPATCRRRPVAANPPQRASPVTRPWSNNPPRIFLGSARCRRRARPPREGCVGKGSQAPEAEPYLSAWLADVDARSDAICGSASPCVFGDSGRRRWSAALARS